MNRNEETNFEKEFEEGNKKVRKSHRKLALSVTAVLIAAIVGLIAVISINAGTEATVPSAVLTLAEPDTLSTSETGQTSGYVLTDVSAVVEQALPSVVSITSRSLVEYYRGYSNGGNGGYGGGYNDIEDIFEYFFGDSYGGQGDSNGYYYYDNRETPEEPEDDSDADEGEDQEHADEVESGMGSGTIISQNDTELLILTSYHVVEDCSSLYVTFNNGADVDGTIKAADASADIAIVAVPLADIDDETMNSIKIATICTTEPKVGEGVIVIGNALGYGTSVTSGIVSAVNREINVEGMDLTVIQTDAAINFGNSGGCMLNARGEIIGISEAKATVSYVEGMCYAIPVASNLELIQQLLDSNEVFNDPNDPRTNTGNGAFLGIYGRDVTAELARKYDLPVEKGIYVSSTVMGSGAQEAGMQGGDIIVGVNGKDVNTMEQLQSELSYFNAGDTLTLSIYRQAEDSYEQMEVDVTLTDRIS